MVSILRSVDPDLNADAIRVVKSLALWINDQLVKLIVSVFYPLCI